MSERRDGDRVVVTGYSAGSHFPRTQAAAQYRVELDGLSPEGPVLVDGSVYGRDLRLRGPGAVRGPILGRGDIALENHSARPLKLMAGLHASGNIVARSRGARLEAMLGRGLTGADYVVRGDVIAEMVSLENAVVFGSVRARRVKLTSCLVLGQVIADEAAVVSASTFLSYESPSIRFEGPCCALHALGVSGAQPTFADYVDGVGKAWPAQLVLYPATFSAGGGALMFRPGVTGSFEAARLEPADWVRVDAITVRRRVQGERIIEERVPTERHVLSIGGRALNFAELTTHVRRITWLLQRVLEFEHYHPSTQQRIRREWQERCVGDERVLLDLSLAPPRRQDADHPALGSARAETTAEVPGTIPASAALSASSSGGAPAASPVRDPS